MSLALVNHGLLSVGGERMRQDNCYLFSNEPQDCLVGNSKSVACYSNKVASQGLSSGLSCRSRIHLPCAGLPSGSRSSC